MVDAYWINDKLHGKLPSDKKVGAYWINDKLYGANSFRVNLAGGKMVGADVSLAHCIEGVFEVL